MTLNELRDKAFNYAEKQGFHENVNFGEKLMLVVSELSEALEADRKKCWLKSGIPVEYVLPVPERYKELIGGSVEEEIADAVIRLGDLAGIYNIDLEWHVKAKMAYNETRSFKHGKEY